MVSNYVTGLADCRVVALRLGVSSSLPRSSRLSRVSQDCFHQSARPLLALRSALAQTAYCSRQQCSYSTAILATCLLLDIIWLCQDQSTTLFILSTLRLIYLTKPQLLTATAIWSSESILAPTEPSVLLRSSVKSPQTKMPSEGQREGPARKRTNSTIIHAPGERSLVG